MRVTENIPQIVAFIESIIGNGHAYVTSQGATLCFVDTYRSRLSCLIFFPQQWIKDETEYPVLFVDPGNVYFDTQSIGNRYGKLVNLGGIVGELGMFMIFCFLKRKCK